MTAQFGTAGDRLVNVVTLDRRPMTWDLFGQIPVARMLGDIPSQKFRWFGYVRRNGAMDGVWLIGSEHGHESDLLRLASNVTEVKRMGLRQLYILDWPGGLPWEDREGSAS